MCDSENTATQKRERLTKAARKAPTKGHDRTAQGRRSFFIRSGSKRLLLSFKSLSAQVGRFLRSSNLTHARQLNCLGCQRSRVKLPPISHYNDLSHSTI